MSLSYKQRKSLRLQHRQGVSIRELARRFRITRAGVRYHLQDHDYKGRVHSDAHVAVLQRNRRAGIHTRGPQSALAAHELWRQLRRGTSIDHLAEKHGCASSTIRRRIRMWGYLPQPRPLTRRETELRCERCQNLGWSLLVYCRRTRYDLAELSYSMRRYRVYLHLLWGPKRPGALK